MATPLWFYLDDQHWSDCLGGCIEDKGVVAEMVWACSKVGWALLPVTIESGRSAQLTVKLAHSCKEQSVRNE